MRKTLLMISMILTIIFAGITPVNAITATGELIASSTTVKPGDTFTITLSLTTDQAFETIGGDQNGGRDNDSFALNYDTNKLEITNQEVVATNVMEMGIDVDENTGEEERATDKVLLVATSGIRTGNLYKWSFKVKDNAEVGAMQISTTTIKGTSFTDEETDILTTPITITIVADSSETGNSDEENTGSNDETKEGQDDKSGQQSDKNENKGNSSTGKSNGGTTIGGASTSGKNPDTTTAASAGKIIPPAGSVAINSLLIAGIVIIGVRTYKKFNQLRDVK